MDSDIITTNSLCRGCKGKLKIEKCSDKGFRWKTVYCENWCFVKTTPKKKIIKKNEYASYIHKDGKSYLDNGDGFYQEAEPRKYKKGIKVIRFGPKYTKEQLFRSNYPSLVYS